MLRVEVRARPDLRCRDGGRGDVAVAVPASRRPVVHVFPYLCEQGRHGEQARADASSSSPLRTLAAAFPDVTFRAESGDDAEALMASSLALFLRSSWRHLGRVNVIVTHGNFLRNEVLRPAGLEGVLANAAVLELDVEASDGGERKKLFLLRHCVSHHNAARRGSSLWTTCASVAALRCLARDLAASAPLYGSSALPRAAISAVALQRDVTPEELERAALAFRSERATPAEVDAYVARGGCSASAAAPPGRRHFCSAGRGTFIL
jgi:broad specificity phosphatase PhoE